MNSIKTKKENKWNNFQSYPKINIGLIVEDLLSNNKLILILEILNYYTIILNKKDFLYLVWLLINSPNPLNIEQIEIIYYQPKEKVIELLILELKNI